MTANKIEELVVETSTNATENIEQIYPIDCRCQQTMQILITTKSFRVRDTEH